MSSKLTFKEALSQEDFAAAKPLILLLNSHLSEADYTRLLKEMQAFTHYKLYLAYNDSKLVGICGYWIATKFYCGKYMEIDNFIMKPEERGKNYGSLILEFLEEIALRENCETLMLDAYLENKKGHRFYERSGYKARGYHFIKKI